MCWMPAVFFFTACVGTLLFFPFTLLPPTVNQWNSLDLLAGLYCDHMHARISQCNAKPMSGPFVKILPHSDTRS